MGVSDMPWESDCNDPAIAQPVHAPVTDGGDTVSEITLIAANARLVPPVQHPTSRTRFPTSDSGRARKESMKTEIKRRCLLPMRPVSLNVPKS